MRLGMAGMERCGWGTACEIYPPLLKNFQPHLFILPPPRNFRFNMYGWHFRVCDIHFCASLGHRTGNSIILISNFKPFLIALLVNPIFQNQFLPSSNAPSGRYIAYFCFLVSWNWVLLLQWNFQKYLYINILKSLLKLFYFLVESPSSPYLAW